MIHRARISDADASDYLDIIAMQNAIIREIQAIIVDLDPDTLGYHKRRFFTILRHADKSKERVKARYEREKEQAKNGREAG